MPRFVWRGVTIDGAWKSGIVYAFCQLQLEEQLLQSGIACTDIKISPVRIWYKKVSYDIRIDCLKRLEVLLASGIKLAEAWLLLAQYATNPSMQEYTQAVASGLEQGLSLQDPLHIKTTPFNAITVSLLSAGYESGQLIRTLQAVNAYLSAINIFYKSIKSALLMPVITFVFMLIMLLGIFLYVIPSMPVLCLSLNMPIPKQIQTIILLSDCLQSWYGLGWGLLCCSLIVCMVSIVAKSKNVKHGIQKVLLWIPLVRAIKRKLYGAMVTRALSCLLYGGIPLENALHIVQNMFSHRLIQENIHEIKQLVQDGLTLSQACMMQQSFLWSSDSIAMIKVGEQSNRLTDFLGTIADIYHEMLVEQLRRIAMLMQPLLVLILGIVIAFLIVSLYMPLIQMAQAL